MLQRHAGVAGLPMASSEGVGSNVRYAPLADTRLVAAVCVCRPYAAKPIVVRGCQGCAERTTGAERKEPGLDAGAHGDYRASPSKDGKPQRSDAGQGSGPRAAPTREASPAMGSLPRRPDPRHRARPVKDRSTYARSAATHEGRGGTLPPHGPPATASPRPARACTALSPGTYRACDRGPPALRLAWYALLPSLVARPEWLSCWCAPRGRALTQEPSGITVQTLAKREERQQRTSDRSGTAA